MTLSCRSIAQRLTAGQTSDNPLVIEPLPDLQALERSGGTSVDLRLGTWFLTPRTAAISLLDIPPEDEQQISRQRLTKTAYVALGRPFILHPRNFVLASTFEWIRLPTDLAGSVVGKSSWGRRGLVVATATSVHPGFSACLTLELANIGEVPIAVYPGMYICQLVLTKVAAGSSAPAISQFVGYRRPVLGDLALDDVFKKLRSKR